MGWPTTSSIAPVNSTDLLLIEDTSASKSKYTTLKDLSAYHSILIGGFTSTTPEAQATAHNVYQDVKFDAPSVDTGSISGISSDNTKFILLSDDNQDGMYMFYSEVQFSDAGSSSKRVEVQLRINGSATGGAETAYPTIDGGPTRTSAVSFLELTNNDYVQVRVKQYSGSAGTLEGGTVYAYKMGPA